MLEQLQRNLIFPRLVLLLFAEFTRLPFRLIGCPENARRLLHDAHQQVVDVVLQLPDVGVLLPHHVLLLDEFLHHFVEGQVAVSESALLLRLLKERKKENAQLDPIRLHTEHAPSSYVTCIFI